ncbi:hypothetical protein NGRA_0505 [Nosema granulosis]|uniref:Uncharacterized protein n=1 Tax=Nosema granulosis TaxID=83296 RepID=A0A9P6L0H2_9MICR|nr:hypothetical protein NGRA_0505 [Nosema granulosis]
MKNIYCGELIEFANTDSVNMIEVVYNEREQFEPCYRYYVKPTSNSSSFALNHFVHTFQCRKMVVNYIKKVKCNDKTGLLRFREFNRVKLEKNIIVNYEVYNVLPPFSIEEYYDGAFVFVYFHDLKLDISVSINGIVHRMPNNVFKCKFNTPEKNILVSGKNFMVDFTLASTEMFNYRLATFQDSLIVSLNLNRCSSQDNLESSLVDKYHQSGDDTYSEILDVYNNLRSNKFDYTADLEKEFKKCNIEGVELGYDFIKEDTKKKMCNKSDTFNIENLKIFTVKNNVVSPKEEFFTKKYIIEQGFLIIRLNLSEIEQEKFFLELENYKLELKDCCLLINDCKLRLTRL